MQNHIQQVLISIFLVLNQILRFADECIHETCQVQEGDSSQYYLPVSCLIKLILIMLQLYKKQLKSKHSYLDSVLGFLFCFLNITDMGLIVKLIPQHDYVSELALRAFQLSIFLENQRDTLNILYLQIMVGLYLILMFSLYTIFQYLIDQCLIQRVCIFFFVSIFYVFKLRWNNQYLLERYGLHEEDSLKGSRQIEYTKELPSVKIQAYQKSRGLFLTQVKQDENLSQNIYRQLVMSEGLSKETDDETKKKIFLNLLSQADPKILVFDSLLGYVYGSYATSFAKELLETPVIRLDKKSQQILNSTQDVLLVKGKQLVKSKTCYTQRTFLPEKVVKIGFNKTLNDIMVMMLKHKHNEQLLNRTVLCLDHGHQKRDIQISLKLVKDVEGSFYIQIYLTDQTVRDIIHRRQWTFKIMRQLFMSFSHEFGTSLNYILALAQIAEDKETEGFNSQLRNDYFSPIRRAGQMMFYKVQDMLDYNKILGKEFQISLASFDLHQMIHNIKELFQDTISHKELQLTTFIISRDLNQDFCSDQQRLEQILVNIIGNAQKFTDRGLLTLQLSNELIQGVNYLKFEVLDTGVGMNQVEQQRLKGLLSNGMKSEEKVSENSVGFGLGLLVSNELALQLSKLSYQNGGGIQFSSVFGSGSRFWFLVKNMSEAVQEEVNLSINRPAIMELGKHISIDLKASEIYKHNSFVDHRDNFSRPRPNHTDSTPQFPINSNHLTVRSKDFNLKQLKTFDTIFKDDAPMLFRDNVLADFRYGDSNSNMDELSEQENAQKFQQINRAIQLNDRKRSFQVIINTPKPEDSSCNCNKVLIVDDEPVNIFALQLLLKKFNVKSDSAMNGIEGVRLFKERIYKKCHPECRGYSLVLMDINMPIMDGYRATEAIRAMQTQQPIICAVTAFVDVRTKKDIYDSGVDYFLNKPVKLSELEGVLKFYFTN